MMMREYVKKKNFHEAHKKIACLFIENKFIKVFTEIDFYIIGVTRGESVRGKSFSKNFR